MRYFTWMAAVLVLLVAAGGVFAQQPEGCDQPEPLGTPVASNPSVDIPPGADTVVHLVIANAAERAGVDASQVTVVSIEAVTWPDGSLGCPQPGMMYIQMIIPGYRIVVDVAGAQQEYHTGSSQTIVLCG
jgi:hypothetical protein